MKQLNSKQTVFYDIEKAIKEYRKFAQNQIAKIDADITLDQALLLALIHDGKGQSQTEQSQLLFKDFASITRMVELLVKNSFLERSVNEKDRRKYNLELTAKGKTTIRKLTPIIFQNRRTALKGIQKTEQDNLKSTLNKIIFNCQNHSK